MLAGEQDKHYHGHTHEAECGCGHAHTHEKECGCGHDHTHEESCDCGHDHTHEEECGCGHDHTHEESCGCGHDYHHGERNHTEREFDHLDDDIPQQIYLLKNLGCANCAAKMEKEINELPQVEAATITYATGQLRVAARNQELLLEELQRICSSIEHQVIVVPGKRYQTQKEEKKGRFAEHRKEVVPVTVGAVLFVFGILCGQIGGKPLYSSAAYIAAYLLLGWKIVLAALKHLRNGRVFDENFLMSTATIAAFAIGDFAEAVGVMLFYRIGEFFEDIAVERSRSQIMEAVDMRPEVVHLVTERDVREVPAESVVPGEVILIRPGDRIGLDGIVLEGESRIDTSPVTGESVPVGAGPGSKILSGCVNKQGALKLEVTKSLEESMVTRILDSVENAAASKPKMDRFITRFARIYTPIVVLAAILTAVVPSLFTGNWSHWIYTAITFLVISCPCALVLSVPLTFFSGIGAGSRQGILFKGGGAIEALKKIKVIVVDKTGTITKGDFRVQTIVPEAGYTDSEVLRIAAECEILSTHPIGQSIAEAAGERGIEIRRPREVEEIPGKGIRAVLEEGEALCGNKVLLERYGIDVSRYRETLSGTEVLVAMNGIYAGCLMISDSIKADAARSVREWKKKGLITAMLTGDTKRNADAIAGEIGIDEVYPKLLPEEKVTKLQELREKYGAVLFVGDGINDAPVLAGADVGAAMGSGADSAIEAADVVFMNSSVSAISQAVDIAERTGRIALQNVIFALTVKALVMILGFAGFANMWMAVFADTGVAMICVLNSIRVLYTKR